MKRSWSFCRTGVEPSAICPVPDEEHTAFELRAAASTSCCTSSARFVVVTDELLELVEHDQGQRDLAVVVRRAQGFLEALTRNLGSSIVVTEGYCTRRS